MRGSGPIEKSQFTVTLVLLPDDCNLLAWGDIIAW